MSLERLNSEYNAFITIQELKGGKGPLSELTFGIKDIIETKDVRTTAGSRILKDYVPSKNAWIVDRVLELGGVILGKTNTHEFAVGATNTSSIVGPARNPRDRERISGGSSGGSAVAVALNMVDVGIGTDTGGSIRIPASLCGVIGFKPSFGLIPTEGVIPFSWTLDTIGVITRDYETLWNSLNWLTPSQGKTAYLHLPRSELRVGLLLFDDKTREMKEKVLEFFPGAKEINLPLLSQYGREARRIIATSEGASYHRTWLNSMSDLYFTDVREILKSGLTIPAVDYINALRVRRLILEEYISIFRQVDVIVSPTTKITAPKISEVHGREREYREDLVANTELFNLVGAPSISIPFIEKNGLPMGLMISGEPYKDGVVLGVSKYLLSSN
ncbi:amidase [Metallosphaera hakonensis]|uniref:Amidase n=1 Tax=Metallosphaera hakonensis JCM 8857 = DSM 7519 TaxID=1293036 RepID=A0A2U9ISH5_9CREN|nr:amidase [Metallosphaera hakonensis]AWR98937.1 amidase [Metallosphaera hakonensis JCM 8857 = DSM 7519]